MSYEYTSIDIHVMYIRFSKVLLQTFLLDLELKDYLVNEL